MKKFKVVYLLAACLVFVIVTGYKTGAGTHGWDCTGAETGLGNPAGCSSGGGCHGGSPTAAITISLELDSAGIPVTNYVGGMSYTVKILGTNTGTLNLPKFGFQIGAIKGSTAVTTPVNAGTWAMPYPTSTHYMGPQAGLYVVGVVEHMTPIAASTGTGGSGSTYTETFNWTAPAPGTGTISFWGVLNAVNNNNTDDVGDKWNKTHIVINELSIPAGISAPDRNDFGLSVYPNPASENITVSYTLEKKSYVSAKICDLAGRISAVCQDGSQDQGLQTIKPDISTLAKGIYMLVLNVDGNVTTKKLVIR